MKKLASKKKVTRRSAYKVPPHMAPGAFVETFTEDKKFFESVRDQFGPLRQGQVAGFTNIIQCWNVTDHTDLRWLAYMMATTWHETACTMQPITEYGSAAYLRKKKYWPFIGRGYVQLTWKANYEKYGIAKTPEKALEPATAAHVMIDGMVNGIFTGKKLSTYFNESVTDPVNARRIINGTDRAQMVAGYYQKFMDALAPVPISKV